MSTEVKLRHFAASAYAKKLGVGLIITEHTAIQMKATSVDEATGMAYRVAKSKWPQWDGWSGHDVICIEIIIDKGDK
jgi:hypothetical protein